MNARIHTNECRHCQNCERRSDWDFLQGFFIREERCLGYARSLEYQVRNLHFALARGAQDVQAARATCDDLGRQLEHMRTGYDSAKEELGRKDNLLQDAELDLQDRRRQLMEYKAERTKNRAMLRKVADLLGNVIHGDGGNFLDDMGQYEDLLDLLIDVKREEADTKEDSSEPLEVDSTRQ